jgi:nucleotide-binding universal stress UspA family protein
MKNILATIDFSYNEKLVMDMASDMAKAFNGKIWLLHVVPPEPEFIGFGVGPQYVRDSRAAELRKERRLMNEYAEQMQEEGVDAQGLVIEGATVDMILDKAEKLDIDLIITGHHEHNFVYKAFFGSVAKGVVKKTKIPVLLVPLE